MCMTLKDPCGSILYKKITHTNDSNIQWEDVKGFGLDLGCIKRWVSYVGKYNPHTYPHTIPMQKSLILFLLSALYVTHIFTTMENLNIHDKTNGQPMNNPMSAEALLDCFLIGKVLSNKPVKFNAIRDGLASSWQSGRGVTIIPIDDKKIMCQFYHLCDMERIYQGGPWLLNNFMVIFRKLSFGEDPTEIYFHHTEIWVQAHHIRYGYLNEKMGSLIGNHMGELIKYDGNNNQSSWRKYMRLRVKMDVNETVRKGWTFEKEDGKVCSMMSNMGGWVTCVCMWHYKTY